MRHEEKFICSDRQLALIEHRIGALLSKDRNQKNDDYRIRSLYFDTADDRLYNESLSGVDNRSKYRIRFYDMDRKFFRIERKDTVGNLKSKRSQRVSYEYVMNALQGEILPADDDGVLKEVYALCRTELLKPVIIVDYRRSAYTYPIGNVRITLDRDVSCTYRTGDFLDEHALLIPVLPYGKHILEVKYDGILPGFIASMIDIGDIERVSFSKYAYSRSVMSGNGRKEDGYGI